MAETKYCSMCGEKLKGARAFCSSCGTRADFDVEILNKPTINSTLNQDLVTDWVQPILTEVKEPLLSKKVIFVLTLFAVICVLSLVLFKSNSGIEINTTTSAPNNSADTKVTYKISGVGISSATVGYLTSNGYVSSNDVKLPFTVSVDAPNLPIISAGSMGGQSSTITCEIDAPGYSPITNTSSGSYASVACHL